MKPVRMMAGVVVLVFGMMSVAALQADTIVAPGAFEDTVGNAGVVTPLDNSEATYQVVYGEDQLTDIGLGMPITGIAWRMNPSGAPPSFPVADQTWSSYDIEVSTSLNPPGSLSNLFADNINPADVIMARSGSLTIPAGSFTNNGQQEAQEFGYVIAFDTQFVYTGGDLLFTIRHTGSGDERCFVDAINKTEAPSYGAEAWYTWSYGGAGGLSAHAIISELTFVPEPASLLLVAVGGLLSMRRAR